MLTNKLLFIGGLDPLAFFVLAVPLLFWGYAIIEILTNSFKDTIDKVVWLLVVLLIPVLGVLIYYAFGRKGLAK